MNNPFQLLVALPAEAKPVISRFDLKRVQPDKDFPLYRNQNISLIISGTGKDNAATAVRQLFQSGQSMSDAAWVNFGIAGHPFRALGEAVLASRVTDSATGDYWPISFQFSPCCDTENILTVEEPDVDYKTLAVIDMEAAGFFPAAQAVSIPGRVHCLKIISDNLDRPADRVNAKQVRRLIGSKLDILENLLRQLS